MPVVDEEPGWLYLCEDGTYARQVVVRRLKSGKIRLVCKNTGGQSAEVADMLMEEAQEIIDKHGIDWGVHVEDAED